MTKAKTQHSGLAEALGTPEKAKRYGIGVNKVLFDGLDDLATELTIETGSSYSKAKTIAALLAFYHKNK